MEKTTLHLRFASREQALAVAAAIAGVEGLEDFPQDGRLGDTRFNIQPIGALSQPTGEADAEGFPIYEALPGFHVLGLWLGAAETVPTALQAFYVDYPVGSWA